MAREKDRKKQTAHPKKRAIDRYEHADKKRVNNPPVGLVTPETDPVAPTHKTYDYVAPVPSVKLRQELDYDPHLDPQLVWAGKKEHSSFEVPTVSLHVHERIDPHTIIDAVRKRNGDALPTQPSLFESREENPPLREAIDFYRHAHGWSNRLIAGDSLLVMNSLLEKEGMAGQVQMAFIDPPYGKTYNSNFQPFVNKREVRDGKDDDLTQEPEMIRAFRDTWDCVDSSHVS
jgi:adenine-specific DNA-methyltransferase